MDYAGMVHALEEIRRLLKPEGLLVDLHPHPDWLFLQVILGPSILAREPKPQTYSEDVLQAESAIADVVRRGLFTVLETIEFDFFTYASSVEDLRTHWDQIQAYDDSPKDEQILLREEQQYERFRLVMRAAGDEAQVAIHERTRITGLRPESKDDGIIWDWFRLIKLSALDAVECAITIQKMIVKHSEENPDKGMELRIGISAGEPVRNDNQLYGASVNLAARLCSHAKPGSILVAQVVRDLVVGKGIPFTGHGDFEAKGFEGPIPLIEVAWKDA